MARIKFATYPKYAGRVRLVNIGNVTHYVDYVPFCEAADIVHQKYTKDLKTINSRPYVTKQSRYGSLEAAVRSLVS